MPSALQVIGLIAIVIAILFVIIFMYADMQQATTPTQLPGEEPVGEPATDPTQPAGKPKPRRRSGATKASASTKAPTSTKAPASAPAATPAAMPVLYDGKGFTGKTLTLASGMTVLKGTNMSGETSAIRVPAGWAVTVFNDEKCTGKSATYTSDMKTLEGTDFNNGVKCVTVGKASAGAGTGTGTIVVAPAGKGPLLHSDKKFMGKVLELVTGQKSLKGTNLMTDTSSITIPAGWSVEVYNDEGCTGKSSVFTSSVDTLEGTGYNNSIKCVKAARLGTPPMSQPAPLSAPKLPPQTAVLPSLTMPTFYADKNFAGKSYQPPTTGMAKFKGLPIANEASSIRVPAGIRVTAYDKDDCTGKSAIFTSDVADLGGSGLNNDIACAIVDRA